MSIQYSGGRDIYSACQNLFDLCLSQAKLHERMLNTNEEISKASKETAVTLEDDTLIRKNNYETGLIGKKPRGSQKRVTTEDKVLPLNEISSARLPDIFMYKKELAFLYIDELTVDMQGNNQCILVKQYGHLSSLFDKDKVLPLSTDENITVNRCPRRVLEAVKRINKKIIPNCVMGCIYMKDDVLTVRGEDGYGGVGEYSYGDDTPIGYEVSKYVEVIFNSIGKVSANVQCIYWLSKGDLRNFVLRKDKGSEELIMTIF